MFAARFAPCGAARVTGVSGGPSGARGNRPGGGRAGMQIVAMGRREKSKKARREQPEQQQQPATGGAAVEAAAAAPQPERLPQQQVEDQREQWLRDQRGPERLSKKDWAEIDDENVRAKDNLRAGPGPGPAGTGLLDRAFSADSMLMFGVDGCLPETVNGRVAMLGFFSAALVEVATGRSFTTQLAFNLTHGVSPAIVTTIIAATLAPAVMADRKTASGPLLGEGIAKYRTEPRAKGGRQYLCDPQAVDCSGLPGRELPLKLGRIGFGPMAGSAWKRLT